MLNIATARSILLDLGYTHADAPSKADVRQRIEENRRAGHKSWKYMEPHAAALLEYLEKNRVPRIRFMMG